MTREEAFELLKKYNQDPFHIRHALTVEAVMRWFANDLGYADEADFWSQVGLLHDIDFELYPDQHCLKAPELLREGGASEELIHAVVSHGYKKKYKSKGFAAGCDRETIAKGAEMLGWDLSELLQKTLDAMKASEDEITAQL